MKNLLISAAIGLLTAAVAAAGDCCPAPATCDPAACGGCDQGCGQGGGDCKACPRCGGQMVCKLVCGTKEVKKTVWNVKCEPFCVANPNFGGRNCCGCGDPNCGGCQAEQGCGDGACGKCAKCDPCAAENAKKVVPPKCGPVRVKKTLQKKEVTCKVPSYKCVPVCCNCGYGNGCGGECGGCAGGETGTKAPAPKTSPSDKLPPAPAPAPGNVTLRTPTFAVEPTAFTR